MRKFSTQLLAIAALFAVLSAAYSAFIFTPLPAPPKPADITQVKFDRSDVSTNDSENISLGMDEFLRFFQKGEFWNDSASLDKVYRSDHFPKPLNAKGGWMYCSGAFATRDGKVFTFTRPRAGVLEISDVEHRSGFLVLPDYK